MKNSINQTMMQYFEWYLKPDATLWNKVITNASYLESIGITSVWLPPAYKAAGGIYDTGYGVYDLYDLGEFNQKETIPTKYGTKEEYLNAIKALKGNSIKVLADIVFNQKMGADETEDVLAVEDDPHNRNTTISEPKLITAWTKYTFPGRENKYSDFIWNWTHFHGVDWDEKEKKNAIYKFYGKTWDKQVDSENGNYDYLMGCDVDLNNVDVVNELKKWAIWYLTTTHVDGFRLDAVKHIRADFYLDFLTYLREEKSQELFAVGEYWSSNLESLLNYLDQTKNIMSLFDVPLHNNLFNAANSNGNYDMRTIFNNTLVKSRPENAVTFIDNHDTEPGQPLESFIPQWFKPLGYSLILLRKDGYPCVFYGDYYGIEEKNLPAMSDQLEPLIKARKYFAYGDQQDYFDDPHIIAWVREGDYEHQNSGLVVIMSNNNGGSKHINVGNHLKDSIFYDYTGNVKETVYVDAYGNGIFYCNSGSVSIWVRKDTIYEK